MLLDGGASTNLKGNKGWTPLHVVAEGGDYHSGDDHDALVAQLLLEHGADVDAPDDDSQTPLHLASSFGRVKVVLVLLNAGANANMKNAEGQTPLHAVSGSVYYSQEDGITIARLLLEHGADPNAQDNNHLTPSDFELYYGRAMVLPCYDDEADANIDQALKPPSPRLLGLEGEYLRDKPEYCPPST